MIGLIQIFQFDSVCFDTETGPLFHHILIPQIVVHGSLLLPKLTNYYGRW